MSDKLFTIESERINTTYAVRILKDDEVIFEISNWNSLGEMHKTECEDIVNVLNEQEATINKLTKNRDRWRELAKLHNGYFNCLEKAIEKAYEEKPYPKIEDIMDIYSELEKEFEDE